MRRLIEGKNSPRGFVQDISIACHIHIKGTDKYIYNVDSRDLCSQSFEDLSNKVGGLLLYIYNVDSRDLLN